MTPVHQRHSKKHFSLFIIIFFLHLFPTTTIAAGPTYVGGTYSTNRIWNPDGSPYIVTSDICLINCATLTITTALPGGGEAPVIIKFNPGKGMRIGINFSAKEYGFLIAQGSASCPITFTTNTAGQYWKGISFMWLPPAGQCTGLYNKLSHCIIEYGAAQDTTSENGKANVLNRSSHVQIDHCTIRNSLHDGIYFTSGSTSAESATGSFIDCFITNNQENGIELKAADGQRILGVCTPVMQGSEISHNGTYGLYCNNRYCNPDIQGGNIFVQNGSYPVRIPAFMRIDANNSFTGNGEQAIEVIGCAIFENKTWHHYGIPYLVKDSNVIIPDDKNKTVTLTIEPGSTIKFDLGKGLILGYESMNDRCGVLKALGTKDQPITFTSIAPEQYWTGIEFHWSQSLATSQFNYCTIEYAGSKSSANSAALLFHECYPQASNITNSTIRYSETNGIRLYCFNAGTSVLHHNNIYANALYDIFDEHNKATVNAELNYWGTPNGPGDDLCSSAVVSSTVKYDPWLEKEFTEPLRITAASANPKQFNPVTGSTSFTWSLAQASQWTIAVLTQQLEKVWSASGSGAQGSVTWNGMSETGGVVSGRCFYRIEADNSSGSAAPARGILTVGDQAVARITEPSSGTLFTAGTDIIISGSAQPGIGGYYELKYGTGESPSAWTSIAGPVYGSRVNEQLATWDTHGLDQPTYTLKLDVHKAGTVYSDVVRIGFFVEENPAAYDTTVTYTYDGLGRLIGASSADGSWITYTYDRVGNRLQENRNGQSPPTAIRLAYLKAVPTVKGVLLTWKTETEVNTAGFNVYRKASKETEYQKINPSLIVSKGSPVNGAEYSYRDIPSKPGLSWYYKLEELETNGHTIQYGPVSTINIALKSLNQPQAFRKSLQTNCD